MLSPEGQILGDMSVCGCRATGPARFWVGGTCVSPRVTSSNSQGPGAGWGVAQEGGWVAQGGRGYKQEGVAVFLRPGRGRKGWGGAGMLQGAQLIQRWWQLEGHRHSTDGWGPAGQGRDGAEASPEPLPAMDAGKAPTPVLGAGGVCGGSRLWEQSLEWQLCQEGLRRSLSEERRHAGGGHNPAPIRGAPAPPTRTCAAGSGCGKGERQELGPSARPPPAACPFWPPPRLLQRDKADPFQDPDSGPCAARGPPRPGPRGAGRDSLSAVRSASALLGAGGTLWQPHSRVAWLPP